MGSAVSIDQAVAHYRKAADMGLPQAMFKLFTLYSDSDSGMKNEAEAARYLNRAADAGHSVALGIKGVAHHEGALGYEKSGAKAVDFLEKAARAGNVEAMKNLAVVFKDGALVPKAPLKALKWYIIARTNGFPEEQTREIEAELRKGLTAAQAATAEKEAENWQKAWQAGAAN